MKNPLTIKIAAILLITVLLLIALSMVSGKIRERNFYLNEARQSIAQSWTGEQTVIGPFLAIPYEVDKKVKRFNAQLQTQVVENSTTAEIRFVPITNLVINADTNTSIRQRGIYQIPVYTSDIHFSGTFAGIQVRSVLDEVKQRPNTRIKSPFLVVGISDSRAITDISELTWQKLIHPFSPGSGVAALDQGIHARLPSLEKQENLGTEDIDIEFTMSLRGMERLSFAPTALSATLSMNSAWQHPEFIGRFLPTEREVSSSGYSANWAINAFASNIQSTLSTCESGDCQGLNLQAMGVNHIDPVDVYLMSERSVKYALLFIGLSFTLFFLYEMLKQLPIHPIQYLLVGCATSIFYLLLVSFSEHMMFWIAYLVAAAACVGVIHLYISAILQSRFHALSFSGLLTLLYGLLYIIITAEDFAFLMGGILTFMTLAALMVSTRRIDWYAVSQQQRQILKRLNDASDADTGAVVDTPAT